MRARQPRPLLPPPGLLWVVAVLALFASGCIIDSGPTAPMGATGGPPSREFPLTGDPEHVAYEVTVEVNAAAAVYDEPMVPWEGTLIVTSPSRLLNDETAPDHSEVFEQLAFMVSPVVDMQPVTDQRMMAEFAPRWGRIVAEFSPHPELCQPGESCRRKYLVEVIRLTEVSNPYSVRWTPVFTVDFGDLGLDRSDEAELRVDVEPWTGPLPSPPPPLGRPSPSPSS